MEEDVIVLPVEHLYYLVRFQVAETLSFKCPQILHTVLLHFKHFLTLKKNIQKMCFWWKLITGLKKEKKERRKRHHWFMASTLNVCKATSVFAEGLNQRLSFV